MICGVALFWYLYSKLDTKEIFSILKSDINYFWIAVSMVISIFSHIARAFRWRLQLRALGLSPSMRSLVNAIFGTYAMNLVFPRLGEVWRCGYIAHREKSSFSQVFGSMVSDRLTDTLTVLILTISVFFLNMNVFLKFLSDYPSVQQGLVNTVTSPWLYAILLLAIGSVLWLFRKNTTNKWALKVKAMVQNLWTGFSTVLKMKGKFQFLFYTIFIWTCYFLQLYVCFFAFHWTKDLGILVALTLYVLGSLSMGLPVQGGLGPWHLAIIAGLSFYGVGATEAGAFALVVHGSQMVLIVLLGIYTFFSIALDRKKNDLPEKDLVSCEPAE